MSLKKIVAAASAAILLTGQASFGAEIRVLTRNIYVGADIFRVIQAPDLPAILAEIVAVYETVLQTDFDARAQALANEIAATDPHLVGLQEVSLVRTQEPGDVLFGNPVPATDVELDYLQMLLDALADRGLDYVVAASVDNADVELPLLTTVSRDIRLTDRDVILVRSDVDFANVLERNFTNKVVVNLGGTMIAFDRGYVAIDARVDGRPYRFVNTHLETGGAFGAAAQSLQAPELIDAFAAEYLPVIMVGDFNASPTDAPMLSYAQLTDAGYLDTWLLAHPGAEGYTCCFNETLDDAGAMLTRRIDHILVHNPAAMPVTVSAAEVLGDEPPDMTPGGLWPSDHAGVFAALELPVADQDGDGFDDLGDNCILVANPDQRDSNGDGFGNRCDADFNGDLKIDFRDLSYFRAQFMSSDADADLDGDGLVNFEDLAIFRQVFFGQPGPAAGRR